jgi:hypothetical protein
VRRLLPCAFLLLASCHNEEPAAPTAEQSSQLNEAEDMLNSMARNEGAQNEEGPEQRPGPSNSSD